MPRVSIAIRAYRRRWLGDAVASVLRQTFRDLELVIYDDEGTLADIAAQAADPRVRYVRAAAKYGASGRFLAAVQHCGGDIIGLLDDDDRYEATFVEQLVAALDTDAAAGIAFCRSTFDVAGRLVVPLDDRPAGRVVGAAEAMLRGGWTVSPSHMLMRRAALDAALALRPMPDGVSPDVWVNMSVALAGWHHVLVDAPLVVYRWHEGQLSRQGVASASLGIATFEQLPLGQTALEPWRDRLLARALVIRGLHHLAAGDREACRTDVARAAHAWPAGFAAERRALAAAAAVGAAGSLAARAWLAWSSAGRGRRHPPIRIGSAARP